MIRLRLALLFALASTGGCPEPRPRTEVLVEIFADAEIEAAADNLVVEVFGGAAGARAQRHMQQFDFAAPDVEWPVRIGLVPLQADVTRTFEVTAVARTGTTALASARVISGYLEGQTLRVSLYLWTACRDVPCNVDETCDELGLCVPATVDPCGLDTLDGGRPRCDRDGGPTGDAGTAGLNCVHGAPALVAEVSSVERECCPSLSGDGRVLYFGRVGGAADGLWAAVRDDPSSPFSTPSPVSPDFESMSFEPAISFDDRHLYYEPTLGVLHLATRGSAGESFMAGAPLSGAITSLTEPTGVDVTADELLLVVAAGLDPNRDLFLLEWSASLGAFDVPVRIDAVASAENDQYGSLTADGRGLYFERSVEGGTFAIFYATRASRSQPFGAPTPIVELDGAGNEVDPDVSYDGTELFFASNRPDDHDIYVSTRTCD